jgi:membrane associated rhomboid family serine protease
MIPLRDHNRSARFPAVTLALIGINVAAFLWELSLGRELDRALFHLGVVPVRYTDPTIGGYFTLLEQMVPFLSSMFLHGGWLHLIGNLWTLWIFGDNVEDRLGRGRYLAHARIDAVIPPFVFGPVIMLPAVLFLGLWFVLQFFNGTLALAAGGRQFGGIAWWAHIGGFVFGLLVCLRARRPRPRPWFEED